MVPGTVLSPSARLLVPPFDTGVASVVGTLGTAGLGAGWFVGTTWSAVRLVVEARRAVAGRVMERARAEVEERRGAKRRGRGAMVAKRVGLGLNG